MTQTGIPFIFMRGGTSRGPYFNRADLPDDRQTLTEVLLSVLGSGHPINIDGIGGGSAVTTKVAMLSRSNDDWADIDYFFAQVSVHDRQIDFQPTCGNILSGVGPAAIEMDMIQPTEHETEIRIRAVNTGAKILTRVKTPRKTLTYEGGTSISGVPGTAAPISLSFMSVVGSSTGSFLPTDHLRDDIDGVWVTCMDVAMPMVIARASDFHLTGYESAEELDNQPEFFSKMEAVRLKAGEKMGMGDVRRSVIPKFGLLAPAREGGTIAVRYFMPWRTHPSLAVTGSQCLASCALTPGTISDGMLKRPSQSPASISLEHPCGRMEVLVDFEMTSQFTLKSAGLVRTARKLADGCVYIPSRIWKGA